MGSEDTKAKQTKKPVRGSEEVTVSTKMSQLSVHHPLGQLSHRGRSLTVFPKSGSDAFLWLPSFS